ncbi:hypothetical protein KFK09_007181 [Dendrobium nobile]|uniref:Endonuclease/exonuclease/phosphatase domain-containing protein n=1 Tax=Dendrobium nobile TaxID=94219 RepID=A0A8T3BR77_DENNO|nr:hypothetical protein KFK09_007181 [Dendrobium nobile]
MTSPTSSSPVVPPILTGCPALLFEEAAILQLAAPFCFTLVDSKHIAIQLSNDLDYSRIFSRHFYYIQGCQMRPLQTDQATASLSRPSVARVLVELDVTKKHPQEIWLGSEMNGYFQKVEIENSPIFCSHCKMHGHAIKECFRLHPNLRKEKSVHNENGKMVSKGDDVPIPSVEINLEKADLDMGAAICGNEGEVNVNFNPALSNASKPASIIPNIVLTDKVLQDYVAQTHSNMDLHDANIILDQEKWVNAKIMNSSNDLVVVLDEGEVDSSKALEICNTDAINNVACNSTDNFEVSHNINVDSHVNLPNTGQKLRNTSTVEDGPSFYKKIILVWILQMLRVKNLCRIHNISVLVLLEPLISMDKLFNTAKILGFKHAFANVSNKIWIFWKDFVRIDFIGDFTQALHCNIESSNFKCVASFVYAATSCSSRKILWDKFVNFHSICTLPWLVGGDFNTIVNPSERVGGLHPIFRSMEDFNDMIMNCNLIDIGFSGNNFTWNRANLWQWLDRVLFNNDWVNVFNATKVVHLSRTLMCLKIFFSNIKEVEEKINALEACCQNDPTDANFAILKEAKLVLTNLQCQEETYWKQKAAIKYLAEGDNNTSFFSCFKENSSLCVAPLLEEVKNTLFDMNADSVAGPDGFTVKFFQHLWHFISDDVYDAVLDFFNGTPIPKFFTSTSIVLIHKRFSTNVFGGDLLPILKYIGLRGISVVGLNRKRKYCGVLHPSLCISSNGHSKVWQRMVQIKWKVEPCLAWGLGEGSAGNSDGIGMPQPFPSYVTAELFRRLKAMLGREPTPVELHSRTHKRQEDQQWIDERSRKAYEDYTRLRETHAASSEGSSGGSVEYSEYRIWSQAVGGMQHGRVYGLGAQAQAYEGMTSSTASSFASSSHESLQAQQISALQAELEQIRKSQADWQAQLQAQVQAQLQAHVQTSIHQHNQLLDEMCKMREQLSGKDVAPPEEESTESE